MPTAKAIRSPSKTKNSNKSRACSAIVVSVGCPSGIGPEVAVAAAAKFSRVPTVLVGDADTIAEAARLRGVAPGRLVPFAPERPLSRGKIQVLQVGAPLGARNRRPGKPTPVSGAAQLAYVDAAFDLVQRLPRSALVTGPVSKEAIATSGERRARGFRGHTEWLQARDAAPSSVMCFASKRLVTSLVTTHLPLGKVSRAVTASRVAEAIVGLVRLLDALKPRPLHVAVCSMNPHAGEGELLGHEEHRAIVPGMQLARRELGRGVRLIGPIGAETAYRKALLGTFDGVVAMYHDQATIPMKLVAFGEAVNVTMGLSVVRTSVDHGTGYDIAWQGVADPSGMLAAMKLGAQLVG